MKLNIKEKIRIKDIINKGRGHHFRRKADGNGETKAEDESFGALVHSSVPILKLDESKKQPAWQNDLVINLACAALVTTVPALFCMSIDSPELLLYALTCPLLFLAVATTGSVKPGKARWIAAAAAAVILLVVAIIWRSGIFSGIGMLINTFYDVAEEAQAYLYDRIPAGYEATDGDAQAGMAWMAGLIGLLTALPPVRMRRTISGLIAIIVMLAFAYYGLLPSAVCIAVMIAALIVAVSRGNILAFVPVALAALILFGAVVLVDPGESYGISRIDENFRDRFALRSALIESELSLYDDLYDEEYEEDMYEDEEDEFEDEGDEVDYATYAIIGLIIFAVACLGAAGYLLYRRLSKKRAQNRMGINSTDPREAVTALFPYAVRWLKGYGVEQSGPSFASMEPALKSEFSDSYARLFMDMYKTWSEAAYSNHKVSEQSRLLMEAFTKDTINQVKSKCKFRDKLRLKLRYAL
ncbi:MAG: hypothetical protein IKG17_06140 [Mogibacterium sp.]|nr:hypothetical protein [Mogibacterium sp.]